MAPYDLTAFADFTWTKEDEGRPDVLLSAVPADLSDHGSHVLKCNARLRGVWEESADGFPSDSERAYSIAWHAGRCGLSKEDTAWLLGEFYTRPGKKKLHRSKLEKTLRAWSKGREEASTEDPGVQTIVEPGPDVEPPPNREEPGPETDGTGEAGQRTAGTKGKKSAPEIVAPFRVLPGPEFLRATFAGATRLVPGIGLTETGVGLLTGAGGDGKSILGQSLMLGWAGADVPLPDLLQPARSLRQLWFFVEDPPGITQERLTKILGGAPIPERLLLFTREEPMQFSGAKGRPNDRTLERLGATLKTHGPIDVVGFDPLVYLHQAEENSSSEMMRWLVPFREVCRQAGAALFIIHHAGWAPDGEDARGRGSTAIRAWADCEVSLRAHTRNRRTLHRLNLVKTNFASRWKDPLTLDLDPNTLRFRVVDEAGTLCPPDVLVAWLEEDHGGVWDGPRADLYAAIAKHFGCSERTAKAAVATAKKAGRLKDHGQRKPLEAVASSPETLF